MSFVFVKNHQNAIPSSQTLKHKSYVWFLMQSQLPQKSGFGLLKYFVKTTLKICKERKMIMFCCLMKVQRNFLFNFDETRQEWQSFWNHQLVSKHNIKRCVGWWVTALLWNYNCSPNNSTQPLLIIYSDKQIKHKNDKEKNNRISGLIC